MGTGFGQAIRDARESAGVSLARLARTVPWTESHLRNVENGNRTATLELAEAYDKALTTGGMIVDLFLAMQSGDDMRRRVILGTLGMVGSLGITDSAILESLRNSLLEAIGTDDWHEVSAEYGRRFMTDPPGEYQKSLAGELLTLRHAITGTNAASARLAAPRLMMLQGMVTGNRGETESAARWYRTARIAADSTGDRSLSQWVRGRESFRRGYEGASPPEVLELARGVDDVEAHLAVAQALGRIGERRQALQSLDDARRLQETTEQEERTIYAMAPWRMALSSAYVYALTGDLAACQSELDLVLPPPAVQRWQAQAEAQRAVAYAKAGDASTALQIIQQIRETEPLEAQSIVLARMFEEVERS